MTMIETIVYISGSMEGRPYSSVKKERDRATRMLTVAGFAVCDPLRHKDTHPDEKHRAMNLAKTKFEITQIIDRDENDIKSCNAVLILTGDKPTSGTWFEFAMATYQCHIPVVVIAPKLRKRMDKEAGGKAFEWTSGKATKVVSNLSEAIDILQWLFTNRFVFPRNALEREFSKKEARKK